MLEIRIHGRGGQGAQVACQILADAFFRQGAWVQAFTAYGGEQCDVEHPAHLVVLDPTLLAELPPGSLYIDGLVLINSPRAPCGRLAGTATVVAVDADAIAHRVGLGPIVATAMVGVFAGATGLVSLEHLAAAVEAGSPTRKRENVQASLLGFREAAETAAMESPS
jgi:pyruvate ferredoxin oxidoreductase gamma subunit